MGNCGLPVCSEVDTWIARFFKCQVPVYRWSVCTGIPTDKPTGYLLVPGLVSCPTCGPLVHKLSVALWQALVCCDTTGVPSADTWPSEQLNVWRTIWTTEHLEDCLNDWTSGGPSEWLNVWRTIWMTECLEDCLNNWTSGGPSKGCHVAPHLPQIMCVLAVSPSLLTPSYPHVQ